MNNKQKWYQSWALWTSIAALIVYVMREFVKIDISETVDGLLDVLLPVLVAFGVVNNPNAKGSLWDNGSPVIPKNTDEEE